jgi:(p)ppGpp synthase/HD superfamily hydrolase
VSSIGLPSVVEGNTMLTSRFLDAVRLANELHGEQQRPGTRIPLIAHLLVVTGLVLEEGGDEDIAIAAMLHEAVEEKGDAALERIHDEFGAHIAAMVLEVSDERTPEDGPWRARKRAHLRHIARVDDDSVLMLLLADKVHNVRSLVRDLREEGDELWRRHDRGPGDQLWYFRELIGSFEGRCSGPLLLDLRRGVTELEELLGLL